MGAATDYSTAWRHRGDCTPGCETHKVHLHKAEWRIAGPHGDLGGSLTGATERNELSIVISGAGKSVRLGSPKKWRRAIELGDLTPETPVEVVSNGRADSSIAGDVPELRMLFEAAGIRSSDHRPSEIVALESTVEQQDDSVPQASLAPISADGDAEHEPSPQAGGIGQIPSTHEPAGAVVEPQPTATSALGLIGAAVLAMVLLAVAVLVLGRTPASPPADVPAEAPPATPVPTNEMLAPGTLVSWDSSKDPSPKSYQFGDLTLTLSSRAAGDGQVLPVLTITPAEGPAVEVLGSARLGAAAADIEIVQVDSVGATPQIYFSSFTGGAHCCVDGQLIARSGAAFSTVSLGQWDYGIKFEDLNGDAVSEILVWDERFLYAFASYAGSVAPPKVLRYWKGAISDVSTAPAFLGHFSAAMEAARQGCLERSNAACAAFVADAARAGQFQTAWDTMLSHYDPTDDWQYPTGCSIETRGGPCPAGSEIRYSNFPDALQAFLIETEYVSPNPSTNAIAPSFDCSRADSANLRLICSTPELAAADIRLAAAYSQAQANSRDPARLKRMQLDWIAARNNGPADVATILDMYERRISELNSPLDQ